MDARLKIFNAFKGTRYTSISDVLNHAEQMRGEILAVQKPKQAHVISSFQALVLPLAQQFQSEREMVKRIAENLLQTGAVPKAPVATVKLKVDAALGKLRNRGLLSHREQLELKPPRVSQVSSEDIRKNMGLVYHIINKGHEYIPRGWRRYLTEEEAVSHGMYGLMRSLQLHDPSKGKFSSFAVQHISSQVGHAVEMRKLEYSRNESLDAPLKDELNFTLCDTLGQPAFDPAALDLSFERRLKVLLRKSTAPHLIALYTLSNFYGFRNQEVAHYFRVSRSAVNQLVNKAHAIATST